MEPQPVLRTGGGAYDYNGEFRGLSDEQHLHLPGLHAQNIRGNWPGGDDWLLPGGVAQPSGTSSDLSDDDEDGQIAPRLGAAGSCNPSPSRMPEGYISSGATAGVIHAPAAATAAAAAGVYQRDPWILQIRTAAANAGSGGGGGGGSSSSPSGSGFQPAFGSLSGGLGSGNIMQQLRVLPGGPLRSSVFGPFGSSSLQHRDSLPSSRDHPLTLAVQHHYHYPPSPTRQQHPSPSSQQQPQPQHHPVRGQLPRPGQHVATAASAAARMNGDGGGGGCGGEGEGESANGGCDSGDGDGDGGGGWPYTDGPPYARATAVAAAATAAAASTSSSSSGASSPSASGNVSPTTGQLPPVYALRTRSSRPPPWYGTRYTNAQYEHDFGLGLGLGLPRRTSSDGDGGDRGLLSRDGEGRSLELDLGQGAGVFGLLAGSGPSMDRPMTGASSASGRSSRSSWVGARGGVGGGEGLLSGEGRTTSQQALLWPLGGDGGGGRPSSGGLRPTGMAAVPWRAGPLGTAELRQRHLGRSRDSDAGSDWRQFREEDPGADALRGSTGLGLSTDRPWGRPYGGLGASNSFSMGLRSGTASLSASRRFSPRSSQAGGSGGLGPGPAGGGGGGMGRLAPLSIGDRGGGGLNVGGGVGGTRCFTSLDSPPPGPYERRRIVLTSAHRRSSGLDSSGPPSVRQYSEGLAGVLTSAQIQEWMSQHASRLLLPRHMHEIADIVFRPPSAATEKKPPRLQPGGSAAAILPPPVVLGGRYPPLHISRLAGDGVFMAGLLAGLAGVDPGNSRVQAVVTALGGKDVTIQEAEGDGPDLQSRPLSGRTPRPGPVRLVQS